MPELPELIVTSRTQSPEKITEVLKGIGYEVGDVSVVTDAPKDESAEQPKEAAGGEVPPAEKPPEAESAEDPKDAATTPDAESAGDGKPAEPEKTSKPGSARWKGRALRSEAENAKLARENEELKRRLEGSDSGQPPKPVTPLADESEPELPPLPEKPMRKAYIEKYMEENPEQSYEDAQDAFEDERDAWKDQVSKVEQKRAEIKRAFEEKKSAREQAKSAQEDAAKRWSEKLASAKKAHPDFDEVLGRYKDDDVPLSDAVTQAIRDSDISGELVYELATHPELLKPLFEMTHFDAKTASPKEIRRKTGLAQLEIEKLEDRIRTAAEQEEDEGEEEPEAPPVAAPPQPIPQRKEPAPPSPPAPPKPKPTPPELIAGRSSTPALSLDELVRQGNEDAARKLDADEWRKKFGM